MKIFPAIDLREGRVVRLTRGDYDRMDVYSGDPLATAQSFLKMGAAYLHVVDLDGAKDGVMGNFEAIERIASLKNLFMQVGGGVRTKERIKALLSLGVKRVILGTAAVRNFAFVEEMLREFGVAIAVGVDALDGKVAVGGWLEATQVDSFDFCQRLRDAGVQTVIYTDISRDGELRGAYFDAYARLNEIKGLDVVASGGVTFEEEIEKLRDMGMYGAIVGKAIYEKRLDLARIISLAGKERA